MVDYNFSHWGWTLPKVSCQCITYGRVDLLEEAIYCFLTQDYPGKKELIILNDHPEITLILKHPLIQVFNSITRFPTIGQKRNYCVSLCTGEIILPWDDDDISLPWRISTVVSEMRNHHYFKPGSYWFMENQKLRSVPESRGAAHAMCGFSKALFHRVGGYPEIQSGQDTGFEKAVSSTGLRDVRQLLADQLYYIYRWGTGHYHLSGFGYNSQDGFERIQKLVRETGTFYLNPVWRKDYASLVRNAASLLAKCVPKSC